VHHPGITEQMVMEAEEHDPDEKPIPDPINVVRTALCVEPRAGKIHVFLPPVELLEDYLDLVAAIEKTAADLKMPIVLEGYLPPQDDRVNHHRPKRWPESQTGSQPLERVLRGRAYLPNARRSASRGGKPAAMIFAWAAGIL
jgi:hypothetical protein